MIKISFAWMVAGLFCVIMSPCMSTSRHERVTLPIMEDSLIHGALPNGLQYFIYRNSSPAKKVSFCLSIKAGAENQRKGQSHVAHVAEHMAFRGTKSVPNPWEFFEGRGLVKGRDINAATGPDRTNFYVRNVDGADSITLVSVLNWFREVGSDLKMDKKRIELCRSEVRAEALSIIGTAQENDRDVNRESVDAFSRNALKRFYNDWYFPANEAVIIVGDVDVSKMEALIKASFAEMRSSGHGPRVAQRNVEPLRKDTVIKLLQKNAITTSASMIYVGGMTGFRSEFEADLMVKLVNVLVTNRMTRIAAVEKRVISGSFKRGDGRDRYGRMKLAVNVSGVDIDMKKALSTAAAEVERIKNHGFDKAEITAGMRQIQQEYSSDAIPSSVLVGDFVDAFIRSKEFVDARKKKRKVNAFIAHTNADSIQAFVRAWFKRKSSTKVVLNVPASNETRWNVDSLLHWVYAGQKIELPPLEMQDSTIPKNKATIADMLGDFGEADTVSVRYQYFTGGLTELTFGNGISVYVRKVPAAKGVGLSIINSVAISALDEDYYVTLYSGGAVRNSGIPGVTSRELNDIFDQAGIEFLGPFVSNNERGIVAKSSLESFDTILRLVAYYFGKPQVDAESLNRLKEALKEMRGGHHFPMTIFQDTINHLTYSPGYVRPATIGQIDELEPSRLETAYQKMFGNSREFVFAIAGAVDSAYLYPMLAKYLGSIVSVKAGESKRIEIPCDIEQQRIARSLKVGEAGAAQVNLSFVSPVAFTAGSRIKIDLMTEMLNQLLFSRMRQKDGSVYNVTVASRMWNVCGGSFRLDITYGCLPDLVRTTMQSIYEELDLLSKKGISEVQLSQAKVQVGDLLAYGLSDPTVQTEYLQKYVIGKNFEGEYADLLAGVANVSVDDMNEFVQRYIKSDQFSSVVLLPVQ